MRRYSVLLIAFALVFFAVGLGWGVWIKNKQAQDLAQSVPLRVLCAENWLSNETLENFSHAHGVRIEQFTYARPGEFLRQMANADANIDVICTTSLLVRSLERSHWLKKMNFRSLPNLQLVAVDFAHLPYDLSLEYTVPVFWNLYGFFGKANSPGPMSWKAFWAGKKIAIWGEELNILNLMARMGVNLDQGLEEEENSRANKTLAEEVSRFKKSAPVFIHPDENADGILQNAEWSEVPLPRVAKFLAGSKEYKFWLPEDGGTLEIGVFAIGEKSARPDLAMKLINELMSDREAKGLHARLQAGVVHASLGAATDIPLMQRAEALRQFPLTRLQFPDINMDTLPRFEKIFEETLQ